MANTMRLIGEEELKGKLGNQLAAGPVRRMLTKGVITVRNHAVEKINVDLGRARQSLAWEVDPSPMPTWGSAGTNIDYGPDLEAGTGPHDVPVAVIEPWATRKGLNAEEIAHGIADHGTRKHPFLAPAFKASTAEIQGFVVAAAREIEVQQK